MNSIFQRANPAIQELLLAIRPFMLPIGVGIGIGIGIVLLNRGTNVHIFTF